MEVPRARGDAPAAKLMRRRAARVAAGAATCLAVAATAGGLVACGSDDSNGSGRGTGMPDRSYKIGFIAPVTGALAPEGVALKRGFELGVAHLNERGGINGHPVRFVFQDSKSTPSVDATVAKKMIQREDVDLLLGGVSSDEAEVLRQLATQARIPYVLAESGPYEAACDHNEIFAAESTQQMLEDLIPFMVEKEGRRWALAGSDFDFPHHYFTIAKGLLEKEGAQVVAEQYAPPATSDYSSFIRKLKDAKPDVVLGAVVGGDAIAFVKQAASLGLVPKVPITGVTLQPEFYPAMGGAIDGMYTSARYSEAIATEANREFVAAYRSRYGKGPIPGVASSAYLALGAIKTAVERAGSYDGHAVFDATNGLDVRTLLADQPLRMGSQRMFEFPMYIVQVQPGGLFKPVGPAREIAPPDPC
jgi:ABC-type branched-subunit amino acid transport system substrate-binding protein